MKLSLLSDIKDIPFILITKDYVFENHVVRKGKSRDVFMAAFAYWGRLLVAFTNFIVGVQ